MIIRSAQMNDSSQLLPLLEQLGYPQTSADLHERLAIYLDAPSYAIFVAEKQNKILGFVALSGTELFVTPKRRARIQALVVQKECRRQGVGYALMQAAEQWAKDHGCDAVDLTSGLRRAKDGSHDFYKALGYKNEGLYAKLYLKKELQ